jgi:hypothetical protein
MLNRLAITFVAAAGLLLSSAALAVTSTPMPEEGFAVASNGHGGSIEPYAVDDGGSAGSGDSTPVQSPDGDKAPVDPTGAKPLRPDHPRSSDGAANPAHKSRGSARWQSLLPGVMK